MTDKLTIYSPAPASTRLHELNEEFGALLQAAGLDNEVIAVALPDSINHISCRSTLIKEKLPLLAYFGDFCASI